MKAMTPGLCFKNVFDFLKTRGGILSAKNEKSLVVHGTVTNIEGKTYSHAWIEEGSKVIDPTQGIKISQKRYYKLLHVANVIKYSPEEASIKAVRAMHYGPWD